ncbi:hypothetical protein NKR19_g8558 [Coniochaeta hoffmannii]|uniref:Thioredoxin-like fold domain-containing protein n=1 Tax=Coniochaeta hoffmannii TaxID=91930 RepID=A0AA38R3Q3_9PEZI|nr:hypothetical protein NKR19_g8558 [Coniochaeta hoffmannii]
MTEPRTRSWMPPIPGPLQRLFDHFPLATYPPNDLPARSPRPSPLPTLYIFASDEDAARGLPSFNPSCLKWQTLLRLSHLPHLAVPSTNHASPTGSLPFLLPPTPALPSPPPRPIPASNIERFILSQPTSPPPTDHFFTPSSSLPPSVVLRQQPYLSLLSGPIRAAWLTALYLDESNTRLLQSLYIDPTSSSPLVRAATLSHLRAAAEREVLRILYPTTGASGGWRLSINAILEFGPGARKEPGGGGGVVNSEEIYREAERAWESLALLLGESETGWFFGVDRPGVFDVGVFAYSYLVGVASGEEEKGGRGLEWGDGGRLDRIVRGAHHGELVRHRERIWDMCWGRRRDGEGMKER